MITEIALENFRCFEKREVQFAPLTLITGSNGVGKTSLLEAISMLSLTTSWKTEKDIEVVMWGKPFTRIVSGNKELVIQVDPYMKRMRIDGVSKRTTQVIGQFPTVLFQPDDLLLLYGAPSFRRAYIDRVLSQTSFPYTQAVLQLGKVLKQRNRLLKNIQEGKASEEELVFWDGELAVLQEVMQKERIEFIEELGRIVPPLFADMVPGGGEISFHYHKSPHDHTHSFLEHLKTHHAKEIAAGNSLYGPHREDIGVSWGGHPVEQSMSRGQSRSLLVAFKIAELEYITKKTEKKPVLLLDDIFSELDTERRERLVGVFGEYQVIMTTTELGSVERLLGEKATVLEF